MCGRHQWPIVVPMATTTITLVLELDEPTDCPKGTVRLADGTACEFHGWLRLAEVIDSFARTSASLGHAETTKGEGT
jgi:hypothetical protein